MIHESWKPDKSIRFYDRDGEANAVTSEAHHLTELAK